MAAWLSCDKCGSVCLHDREPSLSEDGYYRSPVVYRMPNHAGNGLLRFLGIDGLVGCWKLVAGKSSSEDHPDSASRLIRIVRDLKILHKSIGDCPIASAANGMSKAMEAVEAILCDADDSLSDVSSAAEGTGGKPPEGLFLPAEVEAALQKSRLEVDELRDHLRALVDAVRSAPAYAINRKVSHVLRESREMLKEP